VKREFRPNVALAICSDEWRAAYQKKLLELCPTIDPGWLDPNCDLVMQGRMMGETPEQCAEHIVQNQ
jgi:hypothetical protein